MPESDSSPENPQVRKEWIVPRMHRDHEVVEHKVIAADRTNLMISFPLHGGDIDEEGLYYNDEDYPYVDRGVAEYSFGMGGGRPKETRERTFTKRPSFLDLKEGEETDRLFSDSYEQYGGYLNSVGIKKIVEYGELDFYFVNYIAHDGYVLTLRTNKEEDRNLDRRGGDLARVTYDPSDGRFMSLGLGGIFERRENEDVDSPIVTIGVDYEDKQLTLSGSHWSTQRKEWDHLIGPDGNPIFELDLAAGGIFSCRSNDGKEFNFTCAIENGFLVLSQIYRADGTVKTFRAPLILGPEKLEELENNLFSDQPLDKDGVFDLKNAQWRSFDELIFDRHVGAGLSYSYPLPTSQK